MKIVGESLEGSGMVGTIVGGLVVGLELDALPDQKQVVGR